MSVNSKWQKKNKTTDIINLEKLIIEIIKSVMTLKSSRFFGGDETI